MIFIDFDDVIFNTKQFKEDLKQIFSKFGISAETYEGTYHDTADKNIIKIYDPRAQLKRIFKKENINDEKILAAIDEFMTDCSLYVFEDVFEFVKEVGGYEVSVLSYGNLEFQYEKIRSSAIDKVIENIFVTDKSKAEVIRGILKKDTKKKIFFIDDRIDQIHNIKESFPDIITIFVKRPEGRYQEMQRDKSCDHEAYNLIEVVKIIKKYEKKN